MGESRHRFADLFGLRASPEPIEAVEDVPDGGTVSTCGVPTFVSRLVVSRGEDDREALMTDAALRRLAREASRDPHIAEHVRKVWNVPATDATTLGSAMNYACGTPERASESIRAMDADAAFVCDDINRRWISERAGALGTLGPTRSCVAHAFLALDLTKMQASDLSAAEMALYTAHDQRATEWEETSVQERGSSLTGSPALAPLAPYSSPSFSHPSESSRVSSWSPPTPPTLPHSRPIVPPPRTALPRGRGEAMHTRGSSSRERTRRYPSPPGSPIETTVDPTRIPRPVPRELEVRRSRREDRFAGAISTPRPRPPPAPKKHLDLDRILATKSEELELPEKKDQNEVKRLMTPSQYAKLQAGILRCCATSKDCGECKRRGTQEAMKNVIANLPPKGVPTGNCAERATEYLQRMKREGKSKEEIRKGMANIHCTD